MQFNAISFNVVIRNQKCSIFGNLACSNIGNSPCIIFGNKSAATGVTGIKKCSKNGNGSAVEMATIIQ